MNFYNDNLDFTGSKYNNPYALIQKAGKRRRRSMKRRNSMRKRRNNYNYKKTRKYRK